jgi:hypothetical protein
VSFVKSFLILSAVDKTSNFFCQGEHEGKGEKKREEKASRNV